MSKSDIKTQFASVQSDQRFDSQIDKASFYRCTAFSGVELMHARFVNHSFSPHTHEELMIGVIHHGVKMFQREGASHFVSNKGLSIVNAGDVHTGQKYEGDVLLYSALYLPLDIIENAGLPYNLRIHSAVVESSRIRSLFYTVIANANDKLLCEQSLIMALRILAREHSKDYASTRKKTTHITAIDKLIDYMWENYDVNFSLTDLATVVGLSRRHVIRIFKEQTGMTPHSFLISLRIQRAREQLKQDHAITDIALRCGFSDQAHFTKTFRRVIGTTPADYRKSFV